MEDRNELWITTKKRMRGDYHNCQKNYRVKHRTSRYIGDTLNVPGDCPA